MTLIASGHLLACPHRVHNHTCSKWVHIFLHKFSPVAQTLDYILYLICRYSWKSFLQKCLTFFFVQLLLIFILQIWKQFFYEDFFFWLTLLYILLSVNYFAGFPTDFWLKLPENLPTSPYGTVLCCVPWYMFIN